MFEICSVDPAAIQNDAARRILVTAVRSKSKEIRDFTDRVGKMGYFEGR